MTNSDIRNALEKTMALPYSELSLNHPVAAFLGARFIDYTSDGTFITEYSIHDFERNGQGLVQGGLMAAFMDNNFGIFTHTASGGGRMTTIDMTVTYHKPLSPADDTVRICSGVLSAGKRIICMEAKAYNISGLLVASGISNMLNLDGAYLWQ